MGAKLDILFGKFAGYIVGALILICTIFGAGWYVAALRLEATTERAEKTEAQLAVSNASYSSIRDQYKVLTKTLEANQVQALANQADISRNLLEAIALSKPNQRLEAELLARQPSANDCKTPEDLKNAWNKL